MEREYFQNELTKSSRHIHTASAFVRSSGLPGAQWGQAPMWSTQRQLNTIRK